MALTMTPSDDLDDMPVAVAIENDEEYFQPYSVAPQAQRQEPVPVTLITGYLGSGKTTLVRYILQERHGYRIAVILNEYGGETGLESAFVQNEQGDHTNVPQWVELANGCLCCSVKAEFVQALEGLLQTGSAHEGKFDYILVETTGLANPAPIMSELWTDEELEAAVVLDGVVTVVDGRNIGRQLAEKRPGGGANEAQLQLALADVVLLNKMDLLTETDAAVVHDRIRSINSAATVIPTINSRVDLGSLLNRGAYRLRLLDHQQQQQPDDTAGVSAPPAAVNPLQWLGEVTAAATAAAANASDNHCSHSCSVPGCSNPAHQHHLHVTQSAVEQHCAADATCSTTAAAAAAAIAESCKVHDDSVRTISLHVSEPLDMERFKLWVESLIWDHPEAAQHVVNTAAEEDSGPDVAVAAAAAAAAESVGSRLAVRKPELLRMKGLLNIVGSDLAHMFQAVYDLYDIVPGPTWDQLQQQNTSNSSSSGSSIARLSRVVLIGRYLDQQQLQAQLMQCCVAS